MSLQKQITDALTRRRALMPGMVGECGFRLTLHIEDGEFRYGTSFTRWEGTWRDEKGRVSHGPRYLFEGSEFVLNIDDTATRGCLVELLFEACEGDEQIVAEVLGGMGALSATRNGEVVAMALQWAFDEVSA